MPDYTVSQEMMERILAVLRDNWFTGSGEEEYNNDEVINLSDALEAEVKRQDAERAKRGKAGR